MFARGSHGPSSMRQGGHAPVRTKGPAVFGLGTGRGAVRLYDECLRWQWIGRIGPLSVKVWCRNFIESHKAAAGHENLGQTCLQS